MDASKPPKRRKLDGSGDPSFSTSGGSQGPEKPMSSMSYKPSLERSISPPLIRRTIAESEPLPIVVFESSTPSAVISSPVNLIRIESLSPATNVDTISLQEILGDPLIQECWAFNYLFDVDFLMSQFDPDVKDLVQVKVVHGSWKKEDGNRLRMEEAAARRRNVQVITAYMPEAFGTHHSKMFILFKHDDTALVIIHTANIVPGDWRMCQAVWRSPLLPLQKPESRSPNVDTDPFRPIGSGARFKHDLLSYLRSYGNAKTGPLVSRLRTHDFYSVRAALVASTPSKQNTSSVDLKDTLWGWPSLKRILSSIPVSKSKDRPHIVAQVSSVASIGEKWATMFFDVLSTTFPTATSNLKPKISLVFPTPDEIRKSVEGYSSGGSIHMRTQSAAQIKQLNFLRPMLCHWAGDGEGSTSSATIREAGRRRAAPHIKTYIRFSDSAMTKLDWAMVISANLSTQAWGAATNSAGEVRVCSYEIGVVVWPGLWDDEDGSAEMVPVFKKDIPDDLENAVDRSERRNVRVGWRMPYDLPLVPYGREEMPWCATAPCDEPDWMGRVWPGFGTH